MTRGKWVALAVGLAVVAVLVSYGPAVWRTVAYVEEQQTQPLYFWNEGNGWKEDNHVLLRARREWLSGARLKAAMCGWCDESDHLQCPRELAFVLPAGCRIEYQPMQSVGTPEVSAGMHAVMLPCTCADPSHAQESE